VTCRPRRDRSFRRLSFQDAASATSALYANSFRTVESSIRSTGLRTHGLLSDAVRTGSSTATPAYDFLVASRLRRDDVEFELSVGGYYADAGGILSSAVDVRKMIPSRVVALPPSLDLALSLSETVRRRRSVRSYTGEPISLPYLATIVRAAMGITHDDQGLNAQHAPSFRATASAGALYPVTLHLVALRVDGLDPGVYMYGPLDDALMTSGDNRMTDSILSSVASPEGPIATHRAAAICMLIARPARAIRKYGSRGLRHVFLEAGAIAHQINLAATALGVGSVDSSSLYDDEVHEAVGVDGVHETLVHAVVLGVPAEQPR
jgi:SagB-type dehydrogenase family enzyme